MSLVALESEARLHFPPRNRARNREVEVDYEQEHDYEQERCREWACRPGPYLYIFTASLSVTRNCWESRKVFWPR